MGDIADSHLDRLGEEDDFCRRCHELVEYCDCCEECGEEFEECECEILLEEEE